MSESIKINHRAVTKRLFIEEAHVSSPGGRRGNLRERDILNPRRRQLSADFGGRNNCGMKTALRKKDLGGVRKRSAHRHSAPVNLYV